MKRLSPVTVLCVGALMGTLSPSGSDLTTVALAESGGEIGYGHKDFVPTPERPVYFRSNNGWYPGATPPTEWYDVPAAEGEPAKPSKNILWKAPVPGWSLSHPIVVKDRVFAVGEPDFVTCWDLNTGKQLWQRRITPLVCDGLPEDKAKAGQHLLDLARALYYLNASVFPHHAKKVGSMRVRELTVETLEKSPLQKTPAHAAMALVALSAHRTDCAAFGDPALLAALDEDLAVIKRFQETSDPAALVELLTKQNPYVRPLSLIKACEKHFGLKIGGDWWGYVGSADSTLASDGQRIYGVFDQGQVFALDLDGNLVWARREKGDHDNRSTFHNSPLLGDGVLLVRDLSHNNRSFMGVLRALEVATGQQRWEIPFKRSNYGVPRLMRLGDTDVLIGETSPQAIVRVHDGKVLGTLPENSTARGALLSVCPDPSESGAGIVAWGSLSDTGGGHNCGYRLTLDGADAVGVTELWKNEPKTGLLPNQQEFPTLIKHFGFFSGPTGNVVYDSMTGKRVGSFSLESGIPRQSSVIAGHHLIVQIDDGNNGPYGVKDGTAACRYVVVDLSDPTQPKVVSDSNRLGYREPTSDFIVRTYLKDLDPHMFSGCYNGAASYFSLMGGPVPHGNKLLIQSSAYLYCIGTK